MITVEYLDKLCHELFENNILDIRIQVSSFTDVKINFSKENENTFQVVKKDKFICLSHSTGVTVVITTNTFIDEVENFVKRHSLK